MAGENRWQMLNEDGLRVLETVSFWQAVSGQRSIFRSGLSYLEAPAEDKEAILYQIRVVTRITRP